MWLTETRINNTYKVRASVNSLMHKNQMLVELQLSVRNTEYPEKVVLCKTECSWFCREKKENESTQTEERRAGIIFQFPFQHCCFCCCCWVASLVSNSVRPHRRQPTRLPRPWDSPGKNTGLGCHFLLQCMKVKSENEVAQSCLTPSDPMGGSPPGSSVHGIFQARVLKRGAIAFSFPTLFPCNSWPRQP